MVSSPNDSVSACKDFFTTVVESHVIAAALNVFGMENADSIPSLNFFPEGCFNFDSLKQRQVLVDAACAIVEKFVNISCCEVDVQNFDHITLQPLSVALQDISNEGNATALGPATLLTKYEFVAGVFFTAEIMPTLSRLSKTF